VSTTIIMRSVRTNSGRGQGRRREKKCELNRVNGRKGKRENACKRKEKAGNFIGKRRWGEEQRGNLSFAQKGATRRRGATKGGDLTPCRCTPSREKQEKKMKKKTLKNGKPEAFSPARPADVGSRTVTKWENTLAEKRTKRTVRGKAEVVEQREARALTKKNRNSGA